MPIDFSLSPELEEIRATTRDFVPQVVVVDLSPGGVEPVIEVQPPQASSDVGADPAAGRQGGGAAAALPIGLPGKSNWRPYHVDVREDRLLLYGDITKDASTFVYRLRATNSGTTTSRPPCSSAPKISQTDTSNASECHWLQTAASAGSPPSVPNDPNNWTTLRCVTATPLGTPVVPEV